MLKHIIKIILIFTSTLMLSQDTEISIPFHDSIRGKVDLRNGRIIFNLSPKKPEKNNRMFIKNAQIRRGDLLINYRFQKFRGKERNLKFRVLPHVYSVNDEKYNIHPKNLDGTINIDYSSESKDLQMNWSNFLDQYRLTDEDIVIHLAGELYGTPPVDCLNKPKLGNSKLLPHYIIAGGGLGLVVSGLILKSSSDDIYDQYRNEVFNGMDTALDIYNKANGRHKTGDFLKTTGYVVFAGNAAVLLYRYLNFRKKLKDYNYYCSPFEEAKVSAYSEINRLDNTIGVQLALKF